MSRVDDLVSNYEREVTLPWPANLAPPQRIWMAVYPPEDERRVRLHLDAFKIATEPAHEWAVVDITDTFETWIANHDYRDAYFDSPELIQPELAGFMDVLVAHVISELEAKSTPNSVVGLLGAGSLFGLGERVKVSLLVDRVEEVVQGRLLVFFPGEVEQNNYRLLNGRDGWNYHAVAITTEKRTIL